MHISTFNSDWHTYTLRHSQSWLSVLSEEQGHRTTRLQIENKCTSACARAPTVKRLFNWIFVVVCRYWFWQHTRWSSVHRATGRPTAQEQVFKINENNNQSSLQEKSRSNITANGHFTNVYRKYSYKRLCIQRHGGHRKMSKDVF